MANENSLNTLGQLIVSSVPKFVESVTVENGQLVLTCKSSNLVSLLEYLRDSSFLQFNTLLDVFGMDNLQRSVHNRFEVVYFLLSYSRSERLLVRVSLDSEVELPSVSSVFSSAVWLEREIWDMFGLFFKNHPDLRRILTDYGFRGFPLRKDFPISGYTEVRYSEKRKRVIVKPLQLTQEYRFFEFLTPWNQYFNK
jgi:NADH/F420H2 dehydrogenase subunit C